MSCEQCHDTGTVPVHTEGLGFRELAVCGMCAPAPVPLRQLQIFGASTMEKPDFVLMDAKTFETIQRADSIQAAQDRAAQLSKDGRTVKVFSWCHVATFAPPANG